MNEKAPDTLDANEKIQGRKAGFTDIRTLQSKGMDKKDQMGPFKRNLRSMRMLEGDADGGIRYTKGNG